MMLDVMENDIKMDHGMKEKLLHPFLVKLSLFPALHLWSCGLCQAIQSEVSAVHKQAIFYQSNNNLKICICFSLIIISYLR